MNIKKYFKCLIILLTICCITFMFIFFNLIYPLKYKREIIKYSNIYEVNPEIIAGIINTESSFNKNAKSSKGAIGLMQLLPSTAIWLCEKLNIEYKYEYLNEPNFNIKLVTYYFIYTCT